MQMFPYTGHPRRAAADSGAGSPGVFLVLDVGPTVPGARDSVSREPATQQSQLEELTVQQITHSRQIKMHS